MKNFLLTAMLLGSTVVFGQVIGLSGFEVFDDASYKLTVDTEEEVVAKYQAVINVNGFDTTGINVAWGNNPIIFDSFKSEIKGMVNIGIVVKYEGKYDILFATVPNKKTKFFEVLDKDGVVVELIYER
jgi:hypothetical protein